MNELRNPRLTGNAKELRKNMTKEERHLWYDFLKTLPIPVKRQKVFGKYIVDFCIPSAKIIIELDGTQHYEASSQQQDKERDSFLISMGFQVLRYANSDVNRNFRAVCQDIWNHLGYED